MAWLGLFLTPMPRREERMMTAFSGFEPTSVQSVELHQTGTMWTLYWLCYSAAACFIKFCLIVWNLFWSTQLRPSTLTAFAKSLSWALDGINFSTIRKLNSREKLAELVLEPRAAGWEARTLSMCYSAPYSTENLYVASRIIAQIVRVEGENADH